MAISTNQVTVTLTIIGWVIILVVKVVCPISPSQLFMTLPALRGLYNLPFSVYSLASLPAAFIHSIFFVDRRKGFLRFGKANNPAISQTSLTPNPVGKNPI
jgi:hypothetical protein